MLMSSNSMRTLSTAALRAVLTPLDAQPMDTVTSSSASNRFAYSTLLSSHLRDDSDEEIEGDIYILLTRLLLYQLLHHPETRTQRAIPFVVGLLPHVPAKVASLLESEGAIVKWIDPIMPRTWQSTPGSDRWADQFAKLQWFNMTEFDKMLYLDTDMMLTRPLDDIWDEPEAVPISTREPLMRDPIENGLLPDEPPLPLTYLFASVGEQGTRDPPHPRPVDIDTSLQGGFWMMKPDRQLFNYVMTVLEVGGPHGDAAHGRFSGGARFDTSFMEMGLLNYVFRSRGPMPWRIFTPGRWSCSVPNEEDLHNHCASLHDKFWFVGNPAGLPQLLVERWWHLLGRWEGFMDGSKDMQTV
ncbi:hypothetical protein PYCC9005_000282 [Savitreella phatthalungensis]